MIIEDCLDENGPPLKARVRGLGDNQQSESTAAQNFGASVVGILWSLGLPVEKFKVDA